MQTFTNKFSVSMTPDKSEIVLNFSQVIPKIPDDDVSETISQTPSYSIVPVANLVMTGQCAHSLLTVLSKMLLE